MEQSLKSPASGVLLCNIGTPAAATAEAVRDFLRQFLSDPRFTQTRLERWIFRLIVECVILPFRPATVVRKYERIWTPEGSPLLAISRRQAAALERRLNLPVELGMRCGEPSIAGALERLHERGARKIAICPLLPQSSNVATGSIFDAVNEALQPGNLKFELRTEIPNYFDEPLYIEALANAVRGPWDARGRPEKLLVSFHGLPKKVRIRTNISGNAARPRNCWRNGSA